MPDGVDSLRARQQRHRHGAGLLACVKRGSLAAEGRSVNRAPRSARSAVWEDHQVVRNPIPAVIDVPEVVSGPTSRLPEAPRTQGWNATRPAGTSSPSVMPADVMAAVATALSLSRPESNRPSSARSRPALPARPMVAAILESMVRPLEPGALLPAYARAGCRWPGTRRPCRHRPASSGSRTAGR